MSGSVPEGGRLIPFSVESSKHPAMGVVGGIGGEKGCFPWEGAAGNDGLANPTCSRIVVMDKVRNALASS